MAKFKKARDIKVGVVGYGGAFNMGQSHLLQMQQAGMTPTAVTEIDPERRDVASTDFPGIETYASVTAMLKKSDVNLVVIITPHNTHAKLARQCLRAGRHVVCEKPLAITTAECDAMIAEAKRSEVVLSTYHNRHWDGCILEAMDQVCKQKVIGDIYRIEAHMGSFSKPGDWWRSSKSISGGILYDWGVHLLEYSLQLMQADMTEVSGYAKTGHWAPQTRWKQDTIEDEGHAVVRFKNGKWLTLTLSHLDTNPKPGILEITGTAGTYIMEHNTYKIIRQGESERTTITGNNRPTDWEAYYGNIARHLVRGAKLAITPEWSRRPIHILDLAVKSAKLGHAIKTTYK